MQVLKKTIRRIGSALLTGLSAGFVILALWAGLVVTFALPITLGWALR
jgi:hypothetical protein